MHKYLSMAVIVSVLVYLVSCGGGSDESDTTPPVVTITSSTSTSQMPYLLRGTATDNEAVSSLSYSIDNGAVVLISPVQSPFSVELNLAEGIYQLTVIAIDAAGNIASTEISLTYSAGSGVPVKTTENIIDQAFENGELTQEEALLYKVYALFGDNRLPAIFNGENPKGLLDHALDDIMSQYDSLTEETKAVLDPYLVPPHHQGSWWHIRTASAPKLIDGKMTRAADVPPCSPTKDCNMNTDDWSFKDTANGKARVWYLTAKPGDEAVADVIASEIDTTIWPKLTNLLTSAHEPISDINDNNNGGDGRLDISLIDFNDPNLHDGFDDNLLGAYGFLKNYGFGCEKDSVYIVVNIAHNMDEILATVVHEMKHAFQWSYDVAEFCLNRAENYKWLMEASATWAIDYVYEHNQLEQTKARADFFPVPELSLDSLHDNHEYGAYLFPFYLARSFAPVWMRYIWDATTSKDELDVLETGIHNASGGVTNLEEQWAKFTIRNWNRGPIDDYKKWDTLNDGVATIKSMIDPTQANLNGAESKKIDIPVRLPHLSAQYAYFTFTDPGVSSVAFYNGFTHKLTSQQVSFPESSTAYVVDPLSAEDKKGGQVWALMKIGGSWLEPEDWTEKPFKVFCRDEVAERIEELVIIFSNADIDDRERYIEPKGENSLLAYSNTGCWQWQGGAHFVDKDDGVTTEYAVTATWERVTPMVTPVPIEGDGKALVGTSYRISNGNLTWSISGTDSSGCVYSGSKEESLVELFTPGSNVYQNYNYVTAGTAHRGFLLAGFVKNFQPIMATVTVNCPDDPPDVSDIPVYPTLSILPEDANGKVDTTGKIISGDGADTKGGTSVTGNWDFTAKKQP